MSSPLYSTYNIPPSLPPFPHSSPYTGLLRQKLIARRVKLAQAMEPLLSVRVRQIVKQKYNRVLNKIEKARKEMNVLGIHQKRGEWTKQHLVQFYTSLTMHLHDLLPQILNELSLSFSKPLSSSSPTNLLSQTIHLYPSLTGTYPYKPSLKHLLTPTVRTLHQIQQQILQNTNQNRGAQSIMFVMYVISAVFVHLFGKYITREEKIVVGEIVKETFVLSIIYVATAMEVKKEGEWDKMDRDIEEWIVEIKYLVAAKMPKL